MKGTVEEGAGMVKPGTGRIEIHLQTFKLDSSLDYTVSSAPH
jgi:hypothetical protein